MTRFQTILSIATRACTARGRTWLARIGWTRGTGKRRGPGPGGRSPPPPHAVAVPLPTQPPRVFVPITTVGYPSLIPRRCITGAAKGTARQALAHGGGVHLHAVMYEWDRVPGGGGQGRGRGRGRGSGRGGLGGGAQRVMPVTTSSFAGPAFLRAPPAWMDLRSPQWPTLRYWVDAYHLTWR